MCTPFYVQRSLHDGETETLFTCDCPRNWSLQEPRLPFWGLILVGWRWNQKKSVRLIHIVPALFTLNQNFSSPSQPNPMEAPSFLRPLVPAVPFPEWQRIRNRKCCVPSWGWEIIARIAVITPRHRCHKLTLKSYNWCPLGIAFSLWSSRKRRNVQKCLMHFSVGKHSFPLALTPNPLASPSLLSPVILDLPFST